MAVKICPKCRALFSVKGRRNKQQTYCDLCLHQDQVALKKNMITEDEKDVEETDEEDEEVDIPDDDDDEE